ncbi:hypothetical protein A5781_17775 [Mycobacterium sp. 852002-30065_SCH5024008]|nr:hypothetical protein A5781_17775 [Mycobacterium sp. 852002-30065_SCH5024008]
MREGAKPMTDNELDVRRQPMSGLPRSSTNTADIADRYRAQNARVARKSDVGERDLDWNVITLAPNGEISTATEADVDVLIHVLSGSGRLTTEEGSISLTPGSLLWLPSRSRPQFTAGPDGLRYLTVNQKWEILPP